MNCKILGPCFIKFDDQIRKLTGHVGKIQSVIYVPPAVSDTHAASAQSAASGMCFWGSVSRVTHCCYAGASMGSGLLLSAGTDRVVKLWDMRDGRCIRTVDVKSIVNSISLSTDGLLLATGSQDGAVSISELPQCTQLLTEWWCCLCRCVCGTREMDLD